MKGNLRIGKYLNSGIEMPVYIEIEDESSGILFLELHTTLSDIANAIIGHQSAKVEYEIRGIDLIGKTRQTKVIDVPVPLLSFRYSDDLAKQLCEPFEGDGWQARYRDMDNWHNFSRNGGKTCKVVFTRFVDLPEDKKE